MEFSRKKNFIVIFILFLPFLLYFYFIPISPNIFDFISVFTTKYQYLTNKTFTKDFIYETASVTNSLDAMNSNGLPKKLENAPDILRAVYITGWSAGSKNYLNYLNNLFETTQINAVVIDVKDYSGVVSYKTNAKIAKEYKAYYPEIPNIDELIKNLHSKGVYVIGRIVVFQDPVLAKNRPDLAIYDKSKILTESSVPDKNGVQNLLSPALWEDNNGLFWVDPASQEVYDYNIAIAKDAVLHGFDEINFDYVRFPTGGQEDNMGFPIWDKKNPKNFVIKNFFKKLREAFPDTKISIDIFGQVTTNTDDMGIGQILENSFEYFDYVCPMIYPSHYVNGFLGYKSPAKNPYEIIKYALDNALSRQKIYNALQKAKTKNEIDIKSDVNEISQIKTVAINAKIRPWLQDFNLGAEYNADMVGREIKAVNDSMGKDFNGFMLWNPSNIYTKGAIMKDSTDNSTTK